MNIFRAIKKIPEKIRPAALITVVILGLAVILAFALFSYASDIAPFLRMLGDASGYLSIAYNFSSLSDAFFYAGDRTYGFPLFLYLTWEAFSPSSPGDWVVATAYIQFLLHIAACLIFYAFFLKQALKKAGLRKVAATITAVMIIVYPTMVTYTTVPLTDTFCADLLMLAAVLYHRTSRENQCLRNFILCSIGCGLLFGYLVVVRPSLWPPLAAFYGIGLYETAMAKNRRLQLLRAGMMMGAALLFILPTVAGIWEKEGTIGLQDRQFAENAVQQSIQSGLSIVRACWGSKCGPQVPIRGIHDPVLEENYGARCQVESLPDLAKCLLSRPLIIPLYFGKKTLALFDVPDTQPYAVDLTPRWFIFLERVFGALAFCGFISLLVMAARVFMKQPLVWIGAPWAAFAVVLVSMHVLLHIEGRYSFPIVPFSLASLFLGFAAARKAGRRFYKIWCGTMFIAVITFIYQVYSWDLLMLI